MSSRERVLDLLERWQERLEQGRDVPATELCADDPELLPELERRVADLRQLTRLAAEIGQNAEQTSDGAGLAATTSEPGRIGTEPGAPPTCVAGYEVLNELGRGGMGVVYRARDNILKRTVAVKMLPSGEGSPAQRARFRAEAEAIARLQHPHIVQVFQAGEHERQPFFIMEYVAGGSLEKVARQGPHAPAEVARLVMLLARAVHAAHQAGVIHRDLKPANVLLAPVADEPALNTPWGCPKVSDFGLARLGEPGADVPGGQTVPGMVLGTPSYMAPEQAEGRLKEVGPATDVWALGVILYRLLTGRLPFHADSQLATLNLVCGREPEPLRRLRPDVPEALAAVVERCLRKKPQERYSTAASLADDLKRWLEGTGMSSSSGLPAAPRRRLAWAVGMGLLLAVAGGGWLLRGSFSGSTSPTSAPTEPEAVQPFKGWIDVVVSEPKNPRRNRLRLHEPGARPLRPDDEIRIQVQLNRPGYCCIVWFDAEGTPIPIYPWQKLDWTKRPAQEEAMASLWLPAGKDVYPINPGTPGLETLVLLVRDELLPADVRIEELFGKGESQAYGNLEYAAWFENGREVVDEENRAPGEPRKSSNPAVRLQDRIQQRWGPPLFAYSRAVVFGNQGKKTGN